MVVLWFPPDVLEKRFVLYLARFLTCTQRQGRGGGEESGEDCDVETS